MSDAARIRVPGASTPGDMITYKEWGSPQPNRPPREGQDRVLEGRTEDVGSRITGCVIEKAVGGGEWEGGGGEGEVEQRHEYLSQV